MNILMRIWCTNSIVLIQINNDSKEMNEIHGCEDESNAKTLKNNCTVGDM